VLGRAELRPGWKCHAGSCGAGGAIYDLASVLLGGPWGSELRGEAFNRHVPADAPPMPGHPAPDGRWQRGEQLAGLYLAQDPDTMWAEWYRALAELGEPPDLRLPRDLWRFSLTLQRIADLSRPAALRALGLPDPKPDRAQWPAFQDAGARLATDGCEGVLFCSSARPAGLGRGPAHRMGWSAGRAGPPPHRVHRGASRGTTLNVGVDQNVYMTLRRGYDLFRA
jgi:RES domain